KWKWWHLRDRVHQLTLGGHTLSVLPAHLTGATVRYAGYGLRLSVSCRLYLISLTFSVGHLHRIGWTNYPIICAHRVGHPAGRYRYGARRHRCRVLCGVTDSAQYSGGPPGD